jgi:predicted nucleotidyltransferase component of viral defense system
MQLLNLMNTSGREYMYLLARYFNERLLYRVSVSRYRKNFLLKGGSLLYALDGLNTRPTVDVDFMGDCISRDRDYLNQVFAEIFSIECVEDGVTFDVATLRSEPITIEKDYPGTRFFITARMDTIEFPMMVDIGFGDVVTPCPIEIDFPQLLPDIPAVIISAYSLETVVAEKLHTMLDRDVNNSRMKDFFDCYQILTTKQIDSEVLRQAVFATFDNRRLLPNPHLQLFTNAFYLDDSRQKRWQSFLRKIKWHTNIPFDEVMHVITTSLKPIVDSYWSVEK